VQPSARFGSSVHRNVRRPAPTAPAGGRLSSTVAANTSKSGGVYAGARSRGRLPTPRTSSRAVIA